jgi:acetyl esterase/lipase
MPSTARIALDFLRRPERHSYGSHRSQRADLYLPPGAGPYPVVVTIHGGSWRDRYGKIVMKPVCADLTRRGVAAWNIEYRRVEGGGGWPATFDDVGAAIDLLADVAGERVDLNDVSMFGHSAGGQLALWAGSRDQSRVPIKRVVAAAAPSDLRVAEPARGLLGGTPEQVPERYAAANPMQLIPLSMPVLLIHGEDDQTVPVIRSRRYAEAARAAGGDVELIEPVPGYHRVHVDPRSAAWEAAAGFLVRGR